MNDSDFYDASVPHINPENGHWCPCASRYSDGAPQPLIDYTHFMLNPYDGSDALCDSVHNRERVSLNGADVNCPRCLRLMDSPVVRESETRWRALAAEAEQRWRRQNPVLAALVDRRRADPAAGEKET
jgi:hypothetical protein